MIPTLFQIGPFGVHTFGLMMGLGFLAGLYLIRVELVRKGISGELAGTIIFAAIIGGVLGAKLYFWRELTANWREIFSGSGLAWHGGLAGGVIAVLFVLYRSPELQTRDAKGNLIRRRIGEAVDAVAPAILAGQAIGRIGCFLSGDGDYGPPTSLPWATDFSNGVIPTPEGVLVHPTPIYDFILLSLFFGLLWAARKRWDHRPTRTFAAFLVLMGVERIITEYWRLTRVFSFTDTPMRWRSRSLESHLEGTAWQGRLLIDGISEQQIWSLIMVVVGIVLYFRAKPLDSER